MKNVLFSKTPSNLGDVQRAIEEAFDTIEAIVEQSRTSTEETTYVRGSEGRSIRIALEQETLSDGSHVYNLIIGEVAANHPVVRS